MRLCDCGECEECLTVSRGRLERECDRLRQALEASRAETREARELLASADWASGSGETFDEISSGICPWCGEDAICPERVANVTAERLGTHAADCPYAAWYARAFLATPKAPPTNEQVTVSEMTRRSMRHTSQIRPPEDAATPRAQDSGVNESANHPCGCSKDGRYVVVGCKEHMPIPFSPCCFCDTAVTCEAKGCEQLERSRANCTYATPKAPESGADDIECETCRATMEEGMLACGDCPAVLIVSGRRVRPQP